MLRGGRLWGALAACFKSSCCAYSAVPGMTNKDNLFSACLASQAPFQDHDTAWGSEKSVWKWKRGLWLRVQSDGKRMRWLGSSTYLTLC